MWEADGDHPWGYSESQLQRLILSSGGWGGGDLPFMYGISFQYYHRFTDEETETQY